MIGQQQYLVGIGLTIRWRGSCELERVGQNVIQRRVPHPLSSRSQTTIMRMRSSPSSCNATWPWRPRRHSRKWRSKLSPIICHHRLPGAGGGIANKGIHVVLVLRRPQKLPVVPETLLKRRKKIDEVRKARAFARQATVKVCSIELMLYTLRRAVLEL